jgi:hypothetical protein
MQNIIKNEEEKESQMNCQKQNQNKKESSKALPENIASLFISNH